jgi:hypothetical protein
MKHKHPHPRHQRTGIINGMMGFALVLILCQLWLITATVNAYLGNDTSILWPAAITSILCMLLNLGLLRYLYAMED